MKALPIILAAMLLAGCSGMRMHGGDMSGSSSSARASGSSDFYEYQHPVPGDLYFGD